MINTLETYHSKTERKWQRLSYTITTEKRSVSSANTLYACYCCSSCANPVVTRLTVRSTQSGRVGLFGVKDSELSEQASAAQKENTEGLLEYLTLPGAHRLPEGEIEGMDSPCPICGGVEPWQTQEEGWRADPEAPVQVKVSLEFGYAWAQGILRARREAAADPALRQQAEARLRAIEDELRVSGEKKNDGPEAREYAAICEKEAAMTEQFKAFSAFNREKKQMKEALDECRAEKEKARERCLAAAAGENARAARLTIEKAELLLIGKKLSDRAALHENKYSLALALVTEEEQPERSVSLAALPEIGRHAASPHESDPGIRAMLVQSIKQLNDTERLKQLKKEGV